MEATSLWHALLPADVFHSAGVAPDDALLTAAELASLGVVGDSRRRQFAAGRWHARAALARIGHGDADLPRSARGAPAWPDGVVGSIAHGDIEGRVFAVAVVALARDYVALGVDVEPRRTIPPRDWPGLLSVDELASVARASVDRRALAVLQLWCAKEAAAKATPGELPDVSGIEVKIDIGTPGSGDDQGEQSVRTFAARGMPAPGRIGVTQDLVAAFCGVRSQPRP